MPNQLELLVTATDRLQVSSLDPATGFGENATVQGLRGQIRQLTIRRNGESQFAIWIDTNGELTITDMGGLCYHQQMPQQLRLTPHRKWRDH